MFRCSSLDGKVNLVSIQGSYSHGGSNDISGIVLQNYDNDTRKIYDMSENYFSIIVLSIC
jgi:hypothetical protein